MEVKMKKSDDLLLVMGFACIAVGALMLFSVGVAASLGMFGG